MAVTDHKGFDQTPVGDRLDRRMDRRSSSIVTVASSPRSKAARRERMRVLWLAGTARVLLAAESHNSSAILSRCLGDNRLSFGKSANVIHEED
jgi:hypothetical protein